MDLILIPVPLTACSVFEGSSATPADTTSLALGSFTNIFSLQ